jgi:zinc protease
MTNLARTRFPNGLTLLVLPSVHNDIVALHAVLPAGSCLDPPGKSGLAALTFALTMKDTEKRSGHETAEYLESVGGTIAEEVRKDTVGISAVCTSAGLPVTLEVLGDALRRPVFLPDKVHLEKRSQIMTLREEEDSPLTATFNLFQRYLYGPHPYGSPTRGTPETVTSLTGEDVVAFHRRNVRPESTILTVVGNVVEEDVRERMNTLLGDWNGEPAEGVEIPAHAPQPPQERNAERLRSGEGVWSVLGFHAPPITDADYLPVKVLDSILGGSVDSRLFAGVRDRQGLAYTIGTAYPERRAGSFLAAYWGTSPAQRETTLQSVRDQIDTMTQTPPTAEELQRAREYLKGVFVFGRETNLGQASLLGYFESVGWGADRVDDYPRGIERVGRDDILRVARKYMTNGTLAVTAPRTGAKNDRRCDPTSLPNGS